MPVCQELEQGNLHLSGQSRIPHIGYRAAASIMLRQSMGDGAKAAGFGGKHHLKKKKTAHIPNSETQYTDATSPTFQRTYSTLTGDAPQEVIDPTTDTVPGVTSILPVLCIICDDSVNTSDRQQDQRG